MAWSTRARATACSITSERQVDHHQTDIMSDEGVGVGAFWRTPA